MILNIKKADYKGGYKVLLSFNNGETVLVDLQDTVQNDSRRIFFPLRDVAYFKSFKIGLNTITWDNDADFAPEFLLELGKQQESKKMSHA
jgi:hypothetical protein